MLADDVILYEKPSHADVKNARSYARAWYLKTVPLLEMEREGKIQPTDTVDQVLKLYVEEHPDHLAKFELFTSTLDDIQTLMLVTHKTALEVEKLETMLDYEEYEKLLEKCRAVLGGTATDFFLKLQGNMSSKPTVQEMRHPTSTKSRVRRGSGTKK